MNLTRGALKVSGAGNDFIALVEPAADPSADLIRAWCRRGTSLGADGVFTLRRNGAVAEMRHWNADGSPADLCVNGTRCAARIAFELGWADTDITVVTGSGALSARPKAPDQIEVDAPLPESIDSLPLRLESETVRGHRVIVGVPHFVVASPGPVDLVDLPRLGPALRRHHDIGPEGANVDYYQRTGADTIRLRTWERGVEGETLACGSGALAVVAVALQRQEVLLPCRVLTSGGFEFLIDGDVGAGKPTRWSLAGDARIVAELVLLPGASA